MSAAHHTSIRLLQAAAVVLSSASGLPAAQAGSALFATTNIQYLHGSRYADFDPDGLAGPDVNRGAHACSDHCVFEVSLDHPRLRPHVRQSRHGQLLPLRRNVRGSRR